ncbi:hypothetical protein BpHYR1_011677 [Brachionus plicatilis]|uniref:Uncharacterized protein n=1 Tax=Brachionus plicatilis TaxID=10195 RepID=A0A3M7PGG2_BRAPC|nr:hypothetical protein BpHYR1_011677 [Brachionus plicatilis]
MLKLLEIRHKGVWTAKMTGQIIDGRPIWRPDRRPFAFITVRLGGFVRKIELKRTSQALLLLTINSYKGILGVEQKMDIR